MKRNPNPRVSEDSGDEDEVLYLRRDQILKLVTKGFFNELTKYGIEKSEILRVATHLLDNVLQQDQSRLGINAVKELQFSAVSVLDEWIGHRRLSLDGVTLTAFEPDLVPLVANWIRVPAVRDNFVPRFPGDEAGLRDHFERPGQEYFSIQYDGKVVGIIGGENIDVAARKLEMKKLIGEAQLRGKGIGKRATFLFLYHAFCIGKMHKVYVHSRDINVRNINLNSGFGFELEGIFLEDAEVGGRRVDVVRMALLEPIWKALFS